MKQRHWALVTAITLGMAVVPKSLSAADQHLVPLSDVQREAQNSAANRAQNESDLHRVLSLPAAQDAMHKAQINLGQVDQAVAQLNDDELARLADKARAAENDVEGGLIVAILALIGLIVVIIIVVSLVA